MAHTDSVTHARDLDEATQCPRGTTPIADPAAVVHTDAWAGVGAFGEASDDVHDLISVASDALAQRQWRLSGARSASEMRSFIVSQQRALNDDERAKRLTVTLPKIRR